MPVQELLGLIVIYITYKRRNIEDHLIFALTQSSVNFIIIFLILLSFFKYSDRTSSGFGVLFGFKMDIFCCFTFDFQTLKRRRRPYCVVDGDSCLDGASFKRSELSRYHNSNEPF